jgi:Sulfotransferase domain
MIIVGAQKSFTTSVKTYLGDHPSVVTHPQQEMSFFWDESEYERGYKKAVSHYFRGIEKNAGEKIVAKNAILYMSEEGIKRLHEYNPDCKIVLSLRNPVDRAYSAYLMEYNYSDVGFSFSQIKGIAEKADTSYWPYNLFIDAGNYAKYLKMIYRYFPKDNVKVVLCEEIKEDPLHVCRQLFKWLGVDDTFKPEIKVYNPTMKRGSKAYAKFAAKLLKKSPVIRKSSRLIVPAYYNHKIGDVIRKMNKSRQKYGPMDNKTREYLLAYYHDANKELEAITGKRVTALWDK